MEQVLKKSRITPKSVWDKKEIQCDVTLGSRLRWTITSKNLDPNDAPTHLFSVLFLSLLDSFKPYGCQAFLIDFHSKATGTRYHLCTIPPEACKNYFFMVSYHIYTSRLNYILSLVLSSVHQLHPGQQIYLSLPASPFFRSAALSSPLI